MQYSNFNWRNGQPFSETFDDIYYSAGEHEAIPGESEFKHVFFSNNGLPGRWHNCRSFVIAELGFGSGLNCLLTMREWLRHLPACGENKCLHYIAIEKYPLSPDAIASLLSRYPELKAYCDELLAHYPPAVEGWHSRSLFDNRIMIHYRFMDAYDALKDETMDVNAWYLDGFAPAKNTDMWSQKLFEKVAQNSAAGTTCSTYTAAGFVKRSLISNGFTVSKVPGYGSKREMLVARFSAVIKTSFSYSEKPWYCLPKKTAGTDRQATVIGAGIAGLSTAYALVKRGWQVRLIDRQGDICKETSANPAAIVYPRLSVDNDTDTEFYLAAYCYCLYMLKDLQAKHERQFWFDDGLLQLMEKKRALDILNKYNFNQEFVSVASSLPGKMAAAEAESQGKDVYLEYQAAGVVLSAGLYDVIRQQCADQLTVLHAGIDAVEYVNGRWQCRSGSKTVDTSETVVIANGAEVNIPGLDSAIPVEKVRGQIAILKDSAASKGIRKAVNAGKYITPSINGRHYLGATYSRNSETLEIDSAETASLLDTVNEIYPGMFAADDCCDSWAGYRVMSKDRRPVIGLLPDVGFFSNEYADIRHGKKNKDYLPAQFLPGMYINAAHGSRGFTSSFLSAEIVAAFVTGEPAPVSKRVLDYISPSRFVVNDLKRR